MGKFDELIIKAKDLAGVAGSKAQEVAEQAKLRMQITQMKSQIDANYLKLGEIIYELNKSGTQNEELVGMCVAEIETQLAELAELKDKLDEMRKVLRCPDCMSENPRSTARTAARRLRGSRPLRLRTAAKSMRKLRRRRRRPAPKRQQRRPLTSQRSKRIDERPGWSSGPLSQQSECLRCTDI